VDSRWAGSYNLMLVYQEFVLLLIALIREPGCLAALASLVFVCREGFVGFSRPIGDGLGPSQQEH